MVKKIWDIWGKVILNEQVAKDIYTLKIYCPAISQVIQPGQFVDISVRTDYTPLLRRPFSVYRILRQEDCLEFRYKIVGKGTRIMREWKPGSEIKVLGPLGRGFAVTKEMRAIAVIGRGIGLAPLGALSEYAAQHGIVLTACLSADSAEVVDSFEIFGRTAQTIYRQSDDGIFADGTLAIDPLAENWLNLQPDALYVCGSRRLARQAHKLGRQYHVLSQVSMEQNMGCGVGACQCCVIDTFTDKEQQAREYKRVCREGPVFDTWEVVSNG